MVRMSQRIGMGLFSHLKEKRISVDEAAKIVGFPVRDLQRVIEGRLMLAPTALKEIAEKLGLSYEKLFEFEPTDRCLLPELEYNKEFSNNDNLYMIVGFMDEYIELLEQM